MSTQAVAAGIATIAAGISGMRGSSPNLPDAIPASPFTVVGNHRGDLEAGTFERITYRFPLRQYVERTADDARTQQTINGLVDATIAAFRSGITLGTIVAQTRITNWNTDLYAEIAGALYQVVEYEVEVLVASGQTYTA